MITECCFANAIKMYIAHFRLLKLCGVFIASPVRAVVRSNFLIVSISLCWFCSDVQCISGKCRAYPGNRSLCAGDRVEAVTALDILYNDFHRRVYGLLNSSGEERSCGMNYTCPDGEHLCQTRYEMLRHVDLKKYILLLFPRFLHIILFKVFIQGFPVVVPTGFRIRALVTCHCSRGLWRKVKMTGLMTGSETSHWVIPYNAFQ